MMAVGLIPLLFAGKEAKGQARNVEFDAGPVFVSENWVYGNTSLMLSALTEYGSFMAPESRLRFSASKIYVNNEKLDIDKAWKSVFTHWKMMNFSAGWRFGILPRAGFPLGFKIEELFDQEAYKMKDKTLDDPWLVKRQLESVVLLRLRLHSFTRGSSGDLFVGPGYDLALHYHDNIINDKNAVNNGASIIWGLSSINCDSHLNFKLRFEHKLYDFYNKDFVYNGEKIFKTSSSKITRFEICCNYSF